MSIKDCLLKKLFKRQCSPWDHVTWRHTVRPVCLGGTAWPPHIAWGPARGCHHRASVSSAESNRWGWWRNHHTVTNKDVLIHVCKQITWLFEYGLQIAIHIFMLNNCQLKRSSNLVPSRHVLGLFAGLNTTEALQQMQKRCAGQADAQPVITVVPSTANNTCQP